MNIIKQIFNKCKNASLFYISVFKSIVSHNSDKYSNTPGIVLGFDDYTPDTWEQYFDLFDKYGARVTFFVTGDSVTNFMFNAQNRGHEIGYHTITHPRLTELSREQFFEETISRVNLFREAGIELTSFAYPFGSYKSWMHAALLKYYKIVRGFGGLRLYAKEEMKSGLIDSTTIDNICYMSEIKFQKLIMKVVKYAKKYGKIIGLTSHQISDTDWGIKPERLEYILKKCQEYGLTFYRFKDFQ